MTVQFKTRADLANHPAFSYLSTDGDGNPCIYRNRYECDNGHRSEVWHSDWSCACDDKCPICGFEYEAEPTWIGPNDPALIALWEMLPDAGEIDGTVASALPPKHLADASEAQNIGCFVAALYVMLPPGPTKPEDAADSLGDAMRNLMIRNKIKDWSYIPPQSVVRNESPTLVQIASDWSEDRNSLPSLFPDREQTARHPVESIASVSARGLEVVQDLLERLLPTHVADADAACVQEVIDALYAITNDTDAIMLADDLAQH